MKPRFLSLGWMLAALVAMQTWGQTIIPKPRPGAVLRNKTVTNMHSGSAFYLSSDERSVVTSSSGTALSIELCFALIPIPAAATWGSHCNDYPRALP